MKPRLLFHAYRRWRARAIHAERMLAALERRARWQRFRANLFRDEALASRKLLAQESRYSDRATANGSSEP